MGLFFRYLKRAILALVLLAAAIIAAGMIYIRTASFGHLLEIQVGRLLARTFRGEVTLGHIDPSTWGGLTIHELSVRYKDTTIVRIPRVRLDYGVIPLLWHEVRLELIAFDPMIRLRRDSDGEWNLMNALASKSPAARSGPVGFTIYLDKLRIRNADVELAPRTANGPVYHFEGTDLDAAVTIKPNRMDAELSDLRTHIEGPEMPPTDLYAAAFYRDTNGHAQATIDALRLKTPSSAVSIAGLIRDFQTLDSNLTMSIDRLSTADISRLVHNDPLREEINGHISLKGTANAMQVEGALSAGTARFDANLEGDLTRKAPTFKGHIDLANLDLSTLTWPQKLAGILDVSLDARGEGGNLHNLAANAKISGHKLCAGSVRAGNLDLVGSAKNGSVHFNGNVANGPGHLNLDGTALLSGNSQYRIAFKTEHLNAEEFSRSAPRTDLNSQTVITGSGNQLETMDARVEFQAVHSAIARVPLESAIRMRVKAAMIEISRARVISQDTVLSFNGRAGIVPGARVRLSYEVHADQLAPWLKLAGTAGDGRLSLIGTAAGALRGMGDMSLRVQGKLAFQSLHLPNLSIAGGDAAYNFEEIGQTGWPSGDVNTQMTALETSGIKLRALSARVQLDRGPPSRVRMAVVVHDRKDVADRLSATIFRRPDRITGSLDQALLVLPDGTWHLERPAQFTKDQHHFAIEGFALANRDRRLAVDASIEPARAQSIALHARAIDLAVLQSLIPQPQQISGSLSTDIIVGGTAATPTIDGNLAVNKLVINSQTAGDLRATVEYRPSSVALDVTLHQDANNKLQLTGEVPVSLTWVHGFAVTIGADENLRVYSARIRLAPLGAVVPRMLRNLSGELQTDLELTGSPFHPAISGTIDINAGGEAVPLGVTVADLKLRLQASPTAIEIAEFSAKAGSGSLNGSGSIALRDNYSPGAITATLQLQQWPAIATQQYNANINGEIHASGTPDSPRINGEVDVVDSTIHPDLDVLSGTSAPPPDNTILIVQPGEQVPLNGATSRRRANAGQQASNQVFNHLAINLKVNLHRNNWVRHENAQVELDGSLDINKPPGGRISLVGEIDTVRGWLMFHSKRFTLANGQILFTGGSEIDPNLNIDAQDAISNYTVDLIVVGRASKPQIKLQSQPQLGQGDILSLILFGTTTSRLGQGQKTALQQQAQSIMIGSAGQALSQSLGLESMGVNVNGQSVGLGHYINENTYVSVSPNLGANTRGTPSQVASIQYFLLRWLTVTTSTMSDGSRQISLSVSKRY